MAVILQETNRLARDKALEVTLFGHFRCVAYRDGSFELALCVSSLEHEGDDNAPKQHLGFHQYDRVECAVSVGQTRFVV